MKTIGICDICHNKLRVIEFDNKLYCQFCFDELVEECDASEVDLY